MNSQEIGLRVQQAKSKALNYVLMAKCRDQLKHFGIEDAAQDMVIQMIKETYEAAYVTLTQGDLFDGGNSHEPKTKAEILSYLYRHHILIPDDGWQKALIELTDDGRIVGIDIDEGTRAFVLKTKYIDIQKNSFYLHSHEGYEVTEKTKRIEY